MRLKLFFAFLFGRRKQMWLTFRVGFGERFWFYIFKLFFSKNMIHERKFRKKSGISADDMFLFRDEKNMNKFREAEKLNWKESLVEKTRFYGEALGYPDFAIEDFVELVTMREKDNDGHPKSGDRIAFKLISYGYDAFVFRPKNFAKVKIWCEENNLPFEKATFRIRNSETGRWRSLSKDEIEQIISSKNPEKLASEIAQISRP